MPSRLHRFGPFLVDRTGYRVLRGSEPLGLTPKLLDLLFHLLDHSGALVTKEELLDALWPGANVTENALAQAVSELRQVLGDDAGSPGFIKTVARRGYRFIATVEAVEAPAATPIESPPSSAARAGDRTIAVMDFVDVTNDPAARWLSHGIAETVSSDLRALGHFQVVDRSQVTEVVRLTNGSIEQMAAILRARWAVIGSYQLQGGRIRITARVLDVTIGEAVADAKVDGPLDAIFDLQDQIVAQFSAQLGLPAAPGGVPSAGVRETASLEAYRACSEGWLRLETFDVRELPRAVADFERAITVDPRYALAHTGLANAELMLYETSRSDNEPSQDALDRGVAHARHAVHLDGSLAEAHATLALLLVSAWHTSEAAAEARRAVALEPSNWRHLFRLGHASWGDARLRAAANTLALHPDFAFAHFQIAMVHVARNHLSDAETVLRQGAAVQDRQIARGERYPGLGLHWLLGLVRLALEDVDEAVVEFDRESRLADLHRLYGREYAMYAHHGRGAALLRAGRASDAAEAFRHALDLYPTHAQSRLGLAHALRIQGSAASAETEIAAADRTIATLNRSRPIEAATVRALVLVARERFDDAVQILERLVAEAPAGFAGWTLPLEPILSPLRPHHRMAGVLARLADRAR